MAACYSLGLIGYPLGHSLSPALHQAALQACGLEGSYQLFSIPPLPEGRQSLEALLQRLRQADLQGLNVTIPHKQAVLHLVDELTPVAQAIGAVNTLYLRRGQLIGDNTDAAGFLADLAYLPLSGERRALVLGAGGAACAVVYALLQDHWQVHIAARRPEQGTALAQSLSRVAQDAALTVSPLESSVLQKRTEKIHLIVNTTPLGMSPDTHSSPWPQDLPFPKEACLYDLVYNPAETALMQLAQAAGLPVRGGLGMLVEQAIRSFELWTGQRVAPSILYQGISDFSLVNFRSKP